MIEDKITISILDPVCAACPYLKTCKHKRMAFAWKKLNSSKENGVSNAHKNSLPLENGVSNAHKNSLPLARTTKSIIIDIIDGCKTQVYEDELKKRIVEELCRGLRIGDLK